LIVLVNIIAITAQESTKSNVPDIIKSIRLRSTLKLKFCNQVSIISHIIGAAKKIANIIITENPFTRVIVRLIRFAPNTFRILISRILCEKLSDVKPINPISAIATASAENPGNKYSKSIGSKSNKSNNYSSKGIFGNDNIGYFFSCTYNMANNGDLVTKF